MWSRTFLRQMDLPSTGTPTPSSSYSRPSQASTKGDHGLAVMELLMQDVKELLHLSAFLLMEIVIISLFVRYFLNWWIFMMRWLWELPLHLA